MPVVAVCQSANIREPVILLSGPCDEMNEVDLLVRRETEETVIVTPRLRMAEQSEPTQWFEFRYQRVGDTPEFRYCEW